MAQQRLYTEDDYYNIPENVRAELIDGQIYYQAAPNRIHQKILSELHVTIGQYIRTKGGSCEVYPAPFAVKLWEDRRTIVEPDISVICDPDKLTDRGCGGERILDCRPDEKKVLVYHLEESGVELDVYGFEDKVHTHIYEDLWIDFQEIGV